MAATALRGMCRDLGAASSDKIARVVAMVDALAARGEADALMAPLWPRLARLPGPRELDFARLLWIPCEPILEDAAEWQRGGPAVPRSAVASLSALVRRGLGAGAGALDARLAGYRADHAVVVAVEGTALWPRAAAVLAQAAEPPADWSATTGLAARDFRAIGATLSLLLGRAAALLGLDEPAGEPAQGGAAALLAPTLRDPDAIAVPPLTSLLVVMLAYMTDADAVLDSLQAAETDANRAKLRPAREAALAFLLARLRVPRPLPANLVDAAADIERQFALVEELIRWSAQRASPHAAAVAEARRQLDAVCRERLWRGLDHLALPAPVAGAIADDRAVAALEQAARDIRRFELAARRIGGAAFYDRALRETALRATSEPAAAGLTRADRARLMELLVGPEEGLRLWRAGAPPPTSGQPC
jgi:hypothetical protein